MTGNQSTTKTKPQSQLRPDWTGLNIVLMVMGFTFFSPLGLFMLAYMIWGREWGLDFSNWGNVERSMSEAGDKMKTAFDNTFDGAANSNRSRKTGNAAFDEWRSAEMKRLEEERRKLEDAKSEFETYMAELRQARDREEFDRFRAQWKSKENGAQSEDAD